MLRTQVQCADGFRVSIQASSSHYSTPRTNNAPHYTSVELGFPSQTPPDYICPFVEWFHDSEPNYTGSVYPHVPSELVARMLAEHGGVVSGEVPPLLYTDDEENYKRLESAFSLARELDTPVRPLPELAPLNSVFLVQSYDLHSYTQRIETLGVANSAAEAEAMALRYIEQSRYGRFKIVPRDFSGESETEFDEFLYIEEAQMNSLLVQPK